MADDIFLSPEEQDERARQWFKDNGPALAIGIGLGLAAVFGYQNYKQGVQVDSETASGLYQTASAELADSKLASIEEQVATLKSDFSSTTYAAKAVLLKATQTSVNDLSAAFAELQWVIDNAPESGLVHTARIRQAKIKLSQGELEQATSLASHTPTEGFESHYQEVLGDIALKQSDEAAARVHYQNALDALDGLQDNYVQILTIKLDRLPVVDQEEAQTPENG